MKFSDHRTMLDQTGAVRIWYQDVPWDHGLDEVLHASYLDRNYLAFRQRDRVELWAADSTWTCQFLVVAVNKSARTVSTLLTQPPMFLLRSSDRSDLYLVAKLQEVEAAFRGTSDTKMTLPEYEQRMKVLQSLRDHGKYPSDWLADKALQLNRALDAELLTREQHDRAWRELFAGVPEVQSSEVNALVFAASSPASNASPDKPSKKTRPTLVTETPPATV